MRIGIKPGQIGLGPEELQRCWRAAEDNGFESVWTFDHLTGATPCLEATALLAAMAVTTERVRIGCLVLANGLRRLEPLAAQLATVDALSGGRLEVGLGVSSSFARLDYDALDLPYPSWPERLEHYAHAVRRLRQLTGPDTVLAARPHQTPLPLILGGSSWQVRALAREHGLAWNYSAGDTGSVDEFRRLAEGQPDPQVQLFLAHTPDLARQLDGYAQAGATRVVIILTPPTGVADVGRVAKVARLV
jgi:alkanesulfonate monooxygenase SsuD/methylene tetrahydromethanopterin reductase-like flavin-dependent oxidoreductase (luciferase family)